MRACSLSHGKPCKRLSVGRARRIGRVGAANNASRFGVRVPAGILVTRVLGAEDKTAAPASVNDVHTILLHCLGEHPGIGVHSMGIASRLRLAGSLKQTPFGMLAAGAGGGGSGCSTQPSDRCAGLAKTLPPGPFV